MLYFTYLKEICLNDSRKVVIVTTLLSMYDYNIGFRQKSSFKPILLQMNFKAI